MTDPPLILRHMIQRAPIAERLFVPGPPIRLIGGRHRGSGRLVFPCPTDDAFEAVELGARGTLWSYTIQRFRPKSPPYMGPEAFEPFALGYVELPDEIIVETRITGVPFDTLRIGMPMVAVAEDFPIGNSGETRAIYAFTADQGETK